MNVAWLLVLALPEDPATALEQLGRLGAVPECTAQERIEKTEHDHAHHFSPPAALPALEGKYSQLLPFLEHSNRRVVLRAVALMCRTGDPNAPAQVAALARRFPCEHELTRSATAMALSDVGLADCKDPPEPIWRVPARTLAKWKKPAHAATAKAISAGDAQLLERTLWDLDALDPTRAQNAIAILAQLDALSAFLPTTKALRAWQGRNFQYEVLLAGALGAQLDSIGARLKTGRGAVFCAIAGQAAVEDFELLQSLQQQRAFPERQELAKLADVARRAPGLSAFGREFLEELATPHHDWLEGRQAISKMVDHRDRPALRAFFKDEGNGLRDRLEAARELAKIGDASGLVLFQTSDGLWPDAYKTRRQALVELASEAPPAVREQAQALLAKSWTR